MRSRTVPVLVCALSCLAFPALGQETATKNDKDRLKALEEKLSSSEEKVLSLRKDIADLSGQVARLVEQMNAMEALLDEAVTEEARQAMAERMKAAVLSFLGEEEGDREPENVWTVYWRYPRTAWSDDALWALAREYGKKEKQVDDAVDVWGRLVEQHQEIHMEEETVKGLDLSELVQRRTAFREAGGTDKQADRVTALQRLAEGLIRLARLEDAKERLRKALSLCPSETLDAAGEIKALLRQAERMSP